MIKSMTGFGRGEFSDELYSFSVEMKTLNHRYNDIIIKMPKHINFLGEKIKKIIKGKISRGRVEVYIDYKYLSDSEVEIKTDISLANSYLKALENLNQELHINDKVNLDHILYNDDIIKVEKKELDEEKIWSCLKKAVEIALEETMFMRAQEGKELYKDIRLNLLIIEEKAKEIEKRSSLVIKEYKVKLEERVKELLEDKYTLDEDKLSNEIVFFADKSDINEEVIRLYSHINQFMKSFDEKGPVGRKFDFLIQEMNREVNTIGSKANDIEISNNVVEIKSELEKIREQIQNVE
ncbi:MAG TPA: YicC/YloC family endoribonuclease [Tissierellales bacterium]|nr:YicC/YloC family endoribonuclease [Tissierellales bacterium]